MKPQSSNPIEVHSQGSQLGSKSNKKEIDKDEHHL